MNERLVSILKSSWTTHIAAGVAGIGGGVGVGYILWGRNKKAELYLIEDDEPKVDFDFETDGLAERTDQRKKAKVIIEEEAYHSPITVPETTAEVTSNSVIVRPDPKELVEVNVFEEAETEWDWELELLQREGKDAKDPFVLHRDEFHDSETRYTQSHLTYYAGDDIMSDLDGKPVFDYGKVVGDLRFGHGSHSDTVFYVRNIALRGEYEVELHNGRYEVEVQGLDFEEHEAEQDLKHSRVSRFRPE